MTTGVISGMEFLTSATGSSSAISSSNAGERSGGAVFDDLLEQFVEHSADTDAQDERLDALRSTLETMDDSEVVGFLAMLENQSNWQVEQQPLAQVVDLEAWRQQVQGTIQETMHDVVEGSQPLLSEAAGKALEKALEHYMPADESEQQLDVLLKRESLATASQESVNAAALTSVNADEVIMNQQSFAESSSYQPALDMKLQMQVMTDTMSDTLSIQPAQSSIELLGAVPAVAQRVEMVQVQTVSNPAVAQTATQANPEISLRQESWSDAMGQRLITMASEGRHEAQIRLDPPELGVIGVRLVIEESGVSVQMASAVPQVRELLDGQSDRLKYALESQGYDQVDVNVGSDGDRQFAQQEGSRSEGASGAGGVVAQQIDVVDTTSVETAPAGFINTFA
ncbi:hypothetical protein GZ77_06295 [Endozoicomonas montiporae]|uniref:Flagellar hook-length control protein-like C-terminal domain-containing protein n=2 Tax=Endozoicomonas montiporae TaxID=1027273 RepID=A0A081NC97_9GAMM|nr:flagellar hook-length control protein FliK [Endozoicomonas montiporae]AMO56403.1 flagellar hook-length control protein [Endozoicomonas montiporae CL-33]KEQ16070.1 hypothetical protein GZ77_06295 [Endozoicomonas montiporae]